MSQNSFHGPACAGTQTGATATSDAGALMLAEMADRLRLVRSLAEKLHDPRNPIFTVHTMESLLAQRIHTIAAGYEDGDDADDTRDDPALKAAAGKKKEDDSLASQPSVSRIENNLLQHGDNLKTLEDANLEWALIPYRLKGRKRIHLDADSYESPVHGSQEGAAYNGYYRSDCYHPLVLHDGFGSKLKIMLRPGNVHTADGVVPFMSPVFERLAEAGITQITVTGDSGFANPDYFTLCEHHDATYYIRLRTNDALARKCPELYNRPRGRPPSSTLVRYRSFFYKADTWDHYRRVVAKSVLEPGELFPNVYFMATNDRRRHPKQAFRRYGKRRGRAEQRNDEGKNHMFATRLSCHDEAANAVRLQLYTLAYNLLNLFRVLALVGDAARWTVNTIRARLIKIGARVTRHSGYQHFHMAAGPRLRRKIANVFSRIRLLPAPAG
ncbi:MAG: IS1380 family transposase [bacterium]